jgi:catechol 2,3-dioxygenase-like lactoylglutathione lyase family enzyme
MVNKSIQDLTFGRAAPGVSVRDIQAAYAFYSEILGFRKVFENGNPVGFMVLEKDGAEIHLNQFRDHRPTTVNVFHMYVDDVDALYAICEAAGVRIIKSLKDKDYGQRAFVFADPDGNRIDVARPIGA